MPWPFLAANENGDIMHRDEMGRDGEELRGNDWGRRGEAIGRASCRCDTCQRGLQLMRRRCGQERPLAALVVYGVCDR